MRLRLATYAGCPEPMRCVRLHKPWCVSRHKGKRQGALVTVRWGWRMWSVWWESDGKGR